MQTYQTKPSEVPIILHGENGSPDIDLSNKPNFYYGITWDELVQYGRDNCENKKYENIPLSFVFRGNSIIYGGENSYIIPTPQLYLFEQPDCQYSRPPYAMFNPTDILLISIYFEGELTVVSKEELEAHYKEI